MLQSFQRKEMNVACGGNKIFCSKNVELLLISAFTQRMSGLNLHFMDLFRAELSYSRFHLKIFEERKLSNVFTFFAKGGYRRRDNYSNRKLFQL
jgi:hypothetical protein